MRAALSRMVASDPTLTIVGTACSGDEALQKVPSLNPDVITLDVEMPGLNGLDTLRRIMAEFPRPVIMVSSVTLKDTEATFAALGAGAFEYVPKQLASNSLDILHLQKDLVAKIHAAAESRRSREHRVASRKPPRPAVVSAYETLSATPSIIAMGISTGGPKALQDILPALPADLGIPILIVQHMPPGFTGPFAKRLNNLCPASIREAENGETLQPGVVYIAPAGLHVTVDRTSERSLICLSSRRENQLHVPSIDIMMKSVGSAYRSRAMGIIMTGMGSDGAQGMSAIHCEGGFTVGQDEQSCTVYGMPRVCAEMGILDRVVPLSRIPHEILQATRYLKTSAG
jgi:two-component system chemotaxis response regulator CheB